MKVIICGGRHFYDKIMLRDKMNAIHARTPVTCVIEGGALGADRIGRYWAASRSIPFKTEEAKWYPEGPTGKLDRSAGPKRNSQMLKYKPDLVVAFTGGSGKGTRDMIDKARRAGVEVIEYDADGKETKWPAKKTAASDARRRGS